jgi:hypothetical protein
MIIRYNPKLKMRARQLRKRRTPSEALLLSKIRRKSLGYEFHRQVPIDEFIVDFYCHELKLAIEVDGHGGCPGCSGALHKKSRIRKPVGDDNQSDSESNSPLRNTKTFLTLSY